MRFFKTAGVLISFLFLACGDEPTSSPEHNVRLDLAIPIDPLAGLIDSTQVVISAFDFEAPVNVFGSIDSAVSGIFSVELQIVPGTARHFRALLRDIDGRSLFESRCVSDVYGSREVILGMTFNQTGFASGTSVTVFRDQFPWDSRAMDSVLVGQGLTLGTGESCYRVFPSSEMAVADMRPGIDLVIVSNDQPQEFYDNYAASQDRFERFVLDGGSLLWCACDMSWNYGSIAGSGASLPGGVEIDYALASSNNLIDSRFEILQGLPGVIDGNYASQEYFTNIPYGTTIYLAEPDGNPTLIGFAVGAGWVIISGQPLEYNFDRRQAYTSGELLPRLIGFLLGVRSGGFQSPLPGIGTYGRRIRLNQYSAVPAQEGKSRR